MVDTNVLERDLLMASPMLKSNFADQKVCKKKNLSWLFGADGMKLGSKSNLLNNPRK